MGMRQRPSLQSFLVPSHHSTAGGRLTNFTKTKDALSFKRTPFEHQWELPHFRRLLSHFVAQRADAFHRHLNDITRLQKARRVHPFADSSRRSCSDDVARLKRNAF